MSGTYHNRRLTNLRQPNNLKWYRIQNNVGVTDVHIYDEIGAYGVTAQDFVRDLADIRGPMNLHLNSGGGEVFEGLAIYNALKQRGNVTVYIDGLAASIASVIAQAAAPGRLFIGKHASIMIHDGFSQAVGNAEEMRNLADLLDQQSNNIAGIYTDRAGKTTEYWRNQMKKETWYSGQEAVDAGLADAITDDVKNANRSAAMYNAADGGWKIIDGKVVFDPDGDGDDDSRPETDKDHGWWDENCGLMKPIPAMPANIRQALADGTATYGNHDDDDDDDDDDGDDDGGGMQDRSRTVILNADVDNTPWDANKAWHNGATSDDPAAFYKAICAGKKAGDPTKQSSWALPYRYTPSSAPNAAAVRNGLARIDQTQGLINKAKALAKLQKLMRKINPDYNPGNQFNTSPLLAVLAEALKGGSK